MCGDDALAERLATELAHVYRERVTLVVPPSRRSGAGGQALTATTLFSRLQAAVSRLPSQTVADSDVPRVVEAAVLDESTLSHAGARDATALAVVYDDDATNIHAALAARRLNPRLRLVIRLYNRKLGQHLAELLDQAAVLAVPGLDPAALDTSTTVLSDADTAAPALAATAVAGTSKVVQADGLLLRAAERTPSAPDEVARPGLCTLALLSSTAIDPSGAEGSDASGGAGPVLLPDDNMVTAATGRGIVVLETVTHTASGSAPAQPAGRGLPLASLCGGGPRSTWHPARPSPARPHRHR